MQLALLKSESFVPLPLGSAHYVAALQNKPGELDALRFASEETWTRLTPLLQVVGRRTQPATFRSENVSAWVGKASAAVGNHPFKARHHAVETNAPSDWPPKAPCRP